jgi:hypothetical protein
MPTLILLPAILIQLRILTTLFFSDRFWLPVCETKPFLLLSTMFPRNLLCPFGLPLVPSRGQPRDRLLVDISTIVGRCEQFFVTPSFRIYAYLQLAR